MEEAIKTASVSNVNVFIYLFAYYLFRYMCVGMHVQVRAKLAGVDSVLPLCGFQEWNSGPRSLVQSPLPGELSCRSSRMPQQLTIVSTDKAAREFRPKTRRAAESVKTWQENGPQVAQHMQSHDHGGYYMEIHDIVY